MLFEGDLEIAIVGEVERVLVPLRSSEVETLSLRGDDENKPGLDSLASADRLKRISLALTVDQDIIGTPLDEDPRRT